MSGRKGSRAPGGQPAAGLRPGGGSTLGSILWLLCFQFFVAEQVARLHVRGPYSMATDYISDLGALGASLPRVGHSQLYWLMDASFALQGLLILFGAALVRRLFPDGLLMRVGCGLFLLSGAGLVAVGLAPEDLSPPVHFVGAAIHFGCGSFAMLVTGLVLIRGDRRAALGSGLTLAAGGLALAGTLLLAPPFSQVREAAGWPVGFVERIAAYPLPVWLTVTGFALLGGGLVVE